MRIIRKSVPAWIILWLLCMLPAFPWGEYGHDIITTQAIKILPQQLQPFYNRNNRYIVALDVLPDTWKDVHRAVESPRHFINLEYYGKAPKFAGIPSDLKLAEKKYGKKEISDWGTLPWVIENHVSLLSNAFKDKDLNKIVVESTLLAHYCGDLSMPLHLTKYYDGRTSAQKGLHSRFEIELLDRLISIDDIKPPAPEKISDVWKSIYSWMVEGNAKVGWIEKADTEARSKTDRYDAEYYELFAVRAKPTAVKQLSLASSRLAGLYLWAWNKAGKPVLPAKAAPLFWSK